jgi:transposase, IS5 family
VNGTTIIIPKRLPAKSNNYQKQKIREQLRAMADIEPIIGHLKQDLRMSRNFLLDEAGDIVNTMLTAAGFNLRKMLQWLKAGALNRIFYFFKSILFSPDWVLE